ncbi:MAG: hypothetical protein ACI88A_002263 [Paraglaciecola sp.]|jgi:hypothetical protein
MTNKIDLLGSERNIAKVVNTLLLAATVTGVSSLIVNTHNVWSQWNLLTHVLTGGAFSLFVLPYFYVHFSRTLGFRRAGVLFSGLMLLLLFIVAAASGWHIVYFGQSERLAWLYEIHLFSSLSFVAVLFIHIYMHVKLLPVYRKNTALGLFPSVVKGTPQKILASNLILQVVILIATLLYTEPLEPLPSDPVTGDYLYSYGEHPFRPSQTEVSNGGFVAEENIANSFKCFNCHQKIGQQWIASVHQQAASDPTYVTNINLLVKKKGIGATRYCEGCHAPIALLTGQLSPGGEHGGIRGTVANVQGISCMSCHGIQSLPHIKGVASFEFKSAMHYLFENSNSALLQVLNDQLVKMKPSQHKKDLGHPILKDPKVCASCHTQFMDKDINNWGWVKMQDEYGAWAASQFSQHQEENFANENYVRCQDCHMPLVAANDPSANSEGMVRSHNFPGANTFLPLLRGDTKQFDIIKSFLQSNKIRLQIERPHRDDVIQSLLFIDKSLRNSEEAPYFYYLGEQVSTQIVVSNRGVGHDFPAGTIDLNEVWIEFRVTDSTGDLVYVSGEMDGEGEVASESYFYGSKPIDRGGKHVWKHDLFNMVGEAFRRVIKSGESDIVTYQFEIPSWVKSPLSVSARLRYRKLNKRYAKWALKDKYFDIPAIDIAWDSLEIPIKVRKVVTPSQ